MKNLISFFACLLITFATLNAAVGANQPAPGITANDSLAEMPVQYLQHDATITVDGREVTLRAGTAVVLEAAQSYRAKDLNVGQTIMVRVKYNVIVNKQTLISAGALGMAIVSDIRKPRGFGRSGKMELQVQNVQTVDGQQVQVSGIPMVYEGENKKGLAWGLAIGGAILTSPGGGLGFLVGFFIKGKDAEFKAGTTVNATVASDAEIEVERP